MKQELPCLLLWQWRAYWRAFFRRSTAVRSSLILLSLLAAAGLARYITFLRDVAKGTAPGNTALLELTLASLLLLCVVPGWDPAGLALNPRALLRLPLTPRSRIGLRLLSRFIAPGGWIRAAACLAAVWPLSRLVHPAQAMATFMLLAFAAFLLGAAIVDFGATAKGQRLVRVVWPVLICAAAVAWFAGVRRLPPLPSALVVLAGAGNWAMVPLAACLSGAGALLAARAFFGMLGHPPAPQSRSARRGGSGLTLFRRELRQHAGFPEIRTCWLIAAALLFYLATAGRPEPDALRVMLGILAFFTITPAMNHFGPDGGSGLDRLLLWPLVRGRAILEKNKAFAVLAGLPVAPLALLSGWRFGWREGAGNFLEGLALILLTIAWGNVTSVRHPEAADKVSGGYLLDQVAAFAAIGLPTAVAIGALREAGDLALVYLLLSALLCGGAYAASLFWSSRYFARNYERMREGLS